MTHFWKQAKKKNKVFFFRLLLSLSFLLSVSFAYPYRACSEVVNKVLVVINDEVITQGELDKVLIPVYMQYRDIYEGEELTTALAGARKAILEKMIQNKLLLAEAKRRKIEVDPREVEGVIEDVRQSFPSEEAFRETMTRENIYMSQLEERYKEKIMIDKLIDFAVKSKISMAPLEGSRYYEEHPEEFKNLEQVRVFAILIKVTPERDETEAIKLSNRILRRLEEGCDFSLLAREYSDASFAKTGGDMGWIKKGELISELDEAIFQLKTGRASHVIQTKIGFHIFRVEEKKEPSSKTFSEVKDMVEQKIYSQKIEKGVEEFIKDLKENAYISFK